MSNNKTDWEFVAFIICGTIVMVTLMICAAINPAAFN